MLEGIVKGVIEGVGKQVRDFWDWWTGRRQQQQPTKTLDEMLRNPKYKFRETKRLAAAIHDDTKDHKVTVDLLRGMGATANIREDGTDSWAMHKYWEEANPPGTGTDTTGKWKLRKDVKPGKI